MKQLGWTTIEQSEKLIEAGLNPDTADMFYSTLDMHKTPWCWNSKPFLAPNDIPCWSLGALIGLMPEKTLFMYMDDYCTITFDRDKEHTDQFSDKILIVALCKAIEWMLENHIISKIR